jgi:hypothetical protein
MKKPLIRAAVEIGFILFLFYANLLMGEFERSGAAQSRGFLWALGDIFTKQSISIAIVAGIVGYLVVEYLRRKHT